MIKRLHAPSILSLCGAAALTLLALTACDPLAPYATPTPQIIIVTAQPTDTALPTSTIAPTATRTLVPTPTETPAPTEIPCDEDTGQMIDFDDFRSATANETLRYRVYVPPCYIQSQKRYPTIILLHGASYTETQWDDIGADEALEQGRRLGVLGPMILVMPYFGVIGTRNTFPPDRSFETYILDELMPAVQRDFCTWNDREHWGIGGISRGGFWAYSIAMRHPDVFGIVGGHSAAFDPDNAPPANNPLELALNATFLAQANLRMYLDVGAQDPASANLQLFSSRLSARGIDHTYVINPSGDHSQDYWTAHVAEYMTFYGETFPRSTSELPSCLEPSP
ncbi:MAG: alpha/beta hydrolase-fold protein [Anaerolineae bacterium]